MHRQSWWGDENEYEGKQGNLTYEDNQNKSNMPQQLYGMQWTAPTAAAQ
ncbi:hypothetical protein [Rubritalea marina]|nr:hypothetical protein [Rubritalea marina]